MVDLISDFAVIFTGDATEKLRKLRALMATLRELEVAWVDIAQGEQHEQEILGSRSTRQSPSSPAKVEKKIDTYRIIVEEHGLPMHAKEITREALQRGVDLLGDGKTTPEEKVRNSLFVSKKFVNVGGNTWWLVSKPIPEESQE